MGLIRRWILPRAVIREMLPTLVLATGVTTFILLVRSLFLLADLFISYNVPAKTAGKLLLYAAPNVMALTIPIGVLFAVMMTAARWSADSELIALQTAGISLVRVARPMVYSGLLVFVFSAWLTVDLMPRANHAFQLLVMEVHVSGVRAAVEARVFNEDFPGRLLYVNRIKPDSGRWSEILLFDLTSPDQERLIEAASGHMYEDARDGSVWLTLQDTVTHVMKRHQPEAYQQNINRELRIQIESPVQQDGTRRLGVRVTQTPELLRRLRQDELPIDERRQAAIEIHKRLAIPAATVVFALLGFPLGIKNRRGGKGFGFIASLAIVMVYYVLLNNGELLALAGTLPVGLALWLPNLLLGLAAIFALRRAHRILGGAPGGAVGQWWQEYRDRRAARRADAGVDDAAEESLTISGRIRRVKEGAPDIAQRPVGGWLALGILDRYLVRMCLSFFLLVVVAVCTIFIAVNLSENLDDIQRNQIPLLAVVSYYFYSLPQILHDLFPLAFLVAFLATAAVLEKNNESTAIKAAGISLTRIGLPLLGLGIILGVGLFILDESVVQRANRAAQQLHDMIRGRKVARSYRTTDRPWLFLPDGRTLLNFIQFESDTMRMIRPSVFVFNDELQLRSRMVADVAEFREGRWMAEGGWSRTFLDETSPTFSRHPQPVEFPIEIGPEYLGREFRRPSQMNLVELKTYIRTLRSAGYRVDHLSVQLHQKLAYPMSLFLLGWLALPFAFRMGRKGTVVGIAAALVLGMTYFALTAIVIKLGEVSLLPPAAAAWTPNVIFLLLAVNRHTTLRT